MAANGMRFGCLDTNLTICVQYMTSADLFPSGTSQVERSAHRNEIFSAMRIDYGLNSLFPSPDLNFK